MIKNITALALSFLLTAGSSHAEKYEPVLDIRHIFTYPAGQGYCAHHFFVEYFGVMANVQLKFKTWNNDEPTEKDVQEVTLKLGDFNGSRANSTRQRFVENKCYAPKHLVLTSATGYDVNGNLVDIKVKPDNTIKEPLEIRLSE